MLPLLTLIAVSSAQLAPPPILRTHRGERAAELWVSELVGTQENLKRLKRFTAGLNVKFLDREEYEHELAGTE